jgi:hypothetical protein
MKAVAMKAGSETWGELGPAMRALNERQRRFVLAMLLDQGKKFGRLKRCAQSPATKVTRHRCATPHTI